MDYKRLKEILEKMMEESNELRGYHQDSAKFKAWEDKVYRRIIYIYGEDSREYLGFKGINFRQRFTTDPGSHDAVRRNIMEKCLDETRLFFEGLIEDIELFPKKALEEPTASGVSKIFISHSSEDKKVVSEIVHMLSLIGIKDESVFCTSLEGYGIPLGDDWLQTLKSEVSGKVIVLFVLSENYYKSTVSLCEMGAAWALSKKHIPILIPPLDYGDIKGVIPLTQGFKLREKHKWTQLKYQLESLFKLSPKATEIWESRRDEIIGRIENLLVP